jgi:hypothetical protein
MTSSTTTTAAAAAAARINQAHCRKSVRGSNERRKNNDANLRILNHHNMVRDAVMALCVRNGATTRFVVVNNDNY